MPPCSLYTVEKSALLMSEEAVIQCNHYCNTSTKSITNIPIKNIFQTNLATLLRVVYLYDI
jgi:hypothetical protein